METYGGVVDSFTIIYPDIRWRWVASFKLWQLHPPGEIAPVPIS
jgi:hypothetical protein